MKIQGHIVMEINRQSLLGLRTVEEECASYGRTEQRMHSPSYNVAPYRLDSAAVEPNAAGPGQLLLFGSGQQGVSGSRRPCYPSAASVALQEAQGRQRRYLPVLGRAPVSRTGARSSADAHAEASVGEGMMSCPRAGCRKSARPVRRVGCGNGATVRQLRHRQTKGAETVATHLPPPRHISTLLTRSRCECIRPDCRALERHMEYFAQK